MPERSADDSLTLAGSTILDVRSRAELERADLTVFRDSLRRSIVRAGEDAYLRIAVADLDCLRLAAVECSAHSVALDEAERVALLRPVRGEAEVLRRRQGTSVEPGRSLLVDVGERTTRVSHAYQGLQLLLPRARLAEAVAAMTQDAAPARLGDRILDWSSPAGAQLDSHVVDLVRRLGARDGRAPETGWARLAAARALLALVAGAILDSRRPVAAALPRQVRRAEELLRAHAREPITIADLCAELGVGARALQLAFRRHRDTTPQRFLHECRLELARAELRGADADTGLTVASVALACGFTHTGRFAAAYKARFGEAPATTLQHVRKRGIGP